MEIKEAYSMIDRLLSTAQSSGTKPTSVIKMASDMVEKLAGPDPKGTLDNPFRERFLRKLCGE